MKDMQDLREVEGGPWREVGGEMVGRGMEGGLERGWGG